MKQQLSLTLFIILISLFTANAQEVSLYQLPRNLSLPSTALKDTETVELILPRVFDVDADITYPVVFVFDKQNTFIYKNTLQTIDYLTAMMQMPPCIIVGISYDNTSRSKRTLPAYRSKGGQADDALSFLLDELYPVLVKKYKAANFKLFIGHSRTAIFSGYAISKRPRDINGIIASSTSYFDFGQEAEKTLFDQSLDTIASLKRKSFYFFSVGDSLPGGDGGHTASVVKLDNYLRKIKTPPNFIWKSFFHTGASHNTTPGLTVPQALNSIFDRYAETLQKLFKKPFTTDTVTLFKHIEQEYADVSAYYGYSIQPDIVLYNSLSSQYKYSAEVLGEKRFTISRFILEKGVEHYPYFYSFYGDIANLWLRENNTALYRKYLIKALACVDKSPYGSKEEQAIIRNDLIQKLASIKE
jgi:enterochelin esterase-like enzyme